MILFAKQKSGHKCREEAYGYQEEGDWEELGDWD